MKATKSAAAQGAIAGDPHLDGLARRLRQWRARRASKRALPRWVWDRTAEEAREHGVSRVARMLRLDYSKLKGRLVAQIVLLIEELAGTGVFAGIEAADGEVFEERQGQTGGKGLGVSSRFGRFPHAPTTRNPTQQRNTFFNCNDRKRLGL